VAVEQGAPEPHAAESPVRTIPPVPDASPRLARVEPAARALPEPVEEVWIAADRPPPRETASALREAEKKLFPKAPTAGNTLPDDAGFESQGREPAGEMLVVAVRPAESPVYARGSWSAGRPDLDRLQSPRATRGIGQAPPAPVALAPSHVAGTLEESPTLYWFLPTRSEHALELTLLEEDSGEPLLELALHARVPAGIHPLRLSDRGVRLQTGVVYQWLVKVVPDPTRRWRDVISSGFMERVAPTPGLRDALAGAPPLRLGHVYAANGLWYDALDFLSRQIERDPDEAAAWRVHRAALLEQVGLAAAAAGDRLRQVPETE
jgi:hypothetical protein